ncbi:hypothetical protein [Thermomonas sp.]|uniref:hypothetical protein n=1 Tax=Thermomonas sp. TaxID=1971895 RepID=UPI00378371C4
MKNSSVALLLSAVFFAGFSSARDVVYVDIAVSETNGLLFLSIYNSNSGEVEIGPLEYGAGLVDISIGGLDKKRLSNVVAQPDDEAVIRWGKPRILFHQQFIGATIPVSRLGLRPGECKDVTFSYRYSGKEYVVSSRTAIRKRVCSN